MEEKFDYWRDAAKVYRNWRTGHKMLADMTDGELRMFDDYLHVVLVGREFRRLELELQPQKRRLPWVKLLALIPAFLMLFYILSGLFRQ